MVRVIRAARAAMLALVGLLPATAGAAQEAFDVEPSVWDLVLGTHAADLPSDQFADFACGTNGGPPSIIISGWADYATCPAEAATGWHEVYFQYDDLLEYVALARSDAYRAELYRNTSVYSRPVIASALFDADGFMRGLRLVTDPRVDLPVREQAYQLGGFLQSRTDVVGWDCEDLPPGEGETAYKGIFIKEICTQADDAAGIARRLEIHNYRRPGQTILNLDNQPTRGYFEGTTRFEEFLTSEIPDREERLAEIAARPPAEADPLVARAMDCPGCDLAGAILRRVDLRGANLAGANLAGASFHASNLVGANLARANLQGANFNRAQLMQADLSGAEMTGAMLYEARLDGANLAGATMLNIFAGRSRMIRANLDGAVIANSDLTGVLMTNASAVDAIIARSRLWNAQLSRTDFTGAAFAQSDLLDATMTEATLVGADMRVTRLVHVNLRDSDLTGADLSGAFMERANLAGAIIDDVNFTDARLPAGFTPP
ncbi:MAG: pentapeptide repeat-containing protein [Bauldia sp.]|nr:pentapeptide repeat-containing protein [Bauldia sp.]